MAFHQLSCNGLSLAGLLPGQEKISLPPAGVVKCRLLPVANARYSLPPGSAKGRKEWYSMRAPPSSLLTPFFKKRLIYKRKRGAQAGEGAEGEGQADSVLSVGPEAGLNPTTLIS